MSEEYNKKLNKLSKWLFSKSHLQESFDVIFLKTAISKEEALKTLDSSKRVSKILKSILWEMDMNYSPKDLNYLSEIYKDELKSIVPNDIEDKEKGLSIQWLASLGSADKSFAKQVILSAVKNDSAFMSNSLVGDFVSKVLEEEFSFESIGDRLGLGQKLEKFFHWKNFMSEKDLMSIKSFDEFSKVVLDAAPAIESYQKSKKYLDADEGTESLGENEAWEVKVMHNKGAACELGSGTEWCTAAPGLDYFAYYYHPEDPLFYIKDKRNPEDIYQIHFGSGQFKDRRDDDVEPHLQDELIEALQEFGAEKFLAARVFFNYDTFYDLAYDETLFMEFAQDLREYEETIVAPKIEDETYDDSYGPFVKFVNQIKSQIVEGHMPLDDSAMSDEAVALLAKYDPTGFFEIKLHPDYPDLAKEAIMNHLYPKLSQGSSWTRQYNSLDNEVMTEAFNDSTELSELISDPGIAQAHALKLLNSISFDGLLKAKDDMDKHFPDFIDRLVNSAELQDQFGKVVFSFSQSFPAKSWTNANYLGNQMKNDYERYQSMSAREDFDPNLLENNPIEVYKVHITSIDVLRRSVFSQKYPNILNRLARKYVDDGLYRSENQTLDPWAFESLVRFIFADNSIEKYKGEFIQLYKDRLKQEGTIPRWLDKKVNETLKHSDIYDEIQDMHNTAAMNIIKNMSPRVDEVFPNWQSQGISAEQSSEVYYTLRNKGGGNYSFLSPIFEKVINLLTESLYRSSTDQTKNTKPYIEEDLLLFAATFMPGYWDNQNLSYRAANVTDDMRARAEKGLAIIKAEQAKLSGSKEETESSSEEEL